MKACHNCQFNGLSSNACISCCITEKDDSTFRYSQYIADGYDVPYVQQELQEYATHIDPDVEDHFRKALYDLFDLSYTELCLLKAIMNKKTLTSFAADMEKLASSNKTYSRFRAFQLRKALLSKLGRQFGQALLTEGQKKQLKI